ncbi:pentatricopeptide repeat-containing protein At4g21300 isoform X1 [Momordica charantia]|uniref:Pentatricopeptide repeat-containing protein At4g21300 isoform X1 n=1 Tax=Momordica charantia TaxID=3673 RepID=A0A6J1CNN9_MOMCH|nr:pentatricopeptide repeat-containing protein At4g21300 isoform X1 [Momordica charantia]
MFYKFRFSLYRFLPHFSRPEFLFSTESNSKNPINPTLFSTNVEAALASIFQACNHHSLLRQGQQSHAQAIASGISQNGDMGPRILGMYVLTGSLKDAKNVFYSLQLGCTSAWNWMIRGFTVMGWFNYALLFYFKMLGAGIYPDKYTFPYVVKACGALNNVKMGKIVHETVNLMGLEKDAFVGSSLIKLYAENGRLSDAQYLFDNIPQKDCVLWNVMLNGYVKNGDSRNAIKIFLEMRHGEIKPNSVTFACVLSVCAMEAMLDLGTQLHGLAVTCGLDLDSPVANTLLAMYSKCRCLQAARKLFDMMPQSDLVSWNGIISGYVQNGLMSEAEQLFRGMVSAGMKPDSITFASFLPCVTELFSLEHCKAIHGYIVRHAVVLDVFLKSALIDVYFKCRDVEMAQKILRQSSLVDTVVCTAMISGYVLNGMNIEALEAFRWLLQKRLKPTSVTFASVFPAFAGLAALNLGKELHCSIVKNRLDVKCHVGSAVLDMYAKCGRLDLACQVFNRMTEKDAIFWNSMITSCSQNGRPGEAIDLFRQMGMEGTQYDCVSISGALSACANLPALHYGKEIHGFMIKGPLRSDIYAESSLIDMYAKCGNLNFSRRVFDMMQGKNEVSWNSIISAYGNHGDLKECLALFHEMLKNGIQPDHVTFLGIISACGHAGQVDEGIRYYHLMTEDYGIPARMEHYACMADLFGRAGRLDEAFETIKSMPFPPDAGVWGTLLGACHVHGNVELAEVASKYLFDLDPLNSGYYVLLANVQAGAGKWKKVLKVRSIMKERGVRKVPGYSWIEVNNATHMFVAADGSHPLTAQIYSVLDSLLLELRKEGYVPQLYLPMHPQTLSKSLPETLLQD